MIVLHVDSEKTWRGGQQQVAYLTQAMLEAGHTPIVAARGGSELQARMEKLGVKVLPLNYALGGPLAAMQLASFCKKNKIDLVHTHSSRAHSVAALATHFGKMPPIIVSKRTDFPVKRGGFSRGKYENKNVKKIICVSKKIADIVKETLGDDQRTVTVHSGVDPKRFEVPQKDLGTELGLDPEAFLIGNTSAIADQKDYFTFIKTAKELVNHSENIRFVIFGDGPMAQEIKNFAGEQGLQDKVIFTGFRDDLPALLSSLDLFLMTSKTEGLGTSLLDAMLCRVPIVATKAGGIPEIVIHEKTGLLTEIGDVEALTSACLRLINNPDLAKTLAQNAYDMASGEFHRSTTAQKTINIYKEILS